MPRASRIVLPGTPLHITQRGVDRCETFRAVDDFAFYRLALGEASADNGCAVHAYVLMTNHVHLLVTPSDASGPARMMRAIGLRYVPYFNHRHRRTGTLWEGRYHSVVVGSPAYFFTCSRYIELNPVNAGMVGEAGEYEWSSYACNAEGSDDHVITPHSLYRQLAATRSACAEAYRERFNHPLDPNDVAKLRAHRRGAPKLRSGAGTEGVEAG